MPRPVFNIEQYELRGVKPDVFNKAQKDKLNQTLARVNGQMDWTAQLLGFNGPNYWGQSHKTVDGTYHWKGLPDTMNEKRALQVGTHGVYNKNLPYESWPAPFNRTEIRASGDQSFHVFEKDGQIQFCPLGQREDASFTSDPVVFVGGQYIFDREVEVEAISDGAVTRTLFYEQDTAWTRVVINEYTAGMTVSLVGSDANPAILEVIKWEDISDWLHPRVQSQFLGIWGNKGNNLSFDHAFDALDIHGYDEQLALTLTDFPTIISVNALLDLVGLEPTEWTPYYNTMFGFRIGGCDVAYPLPPYAAGELYDNDWYERTIEPDDEYLNNGEYDAGVIPTGSVDEGIYERLPEDPILPQDYTFFECETDCNYRVTAKQNHDQARVKGILNFSFFYENLTQCGKLGFPTIEWVFDQTLDNGLYTRTFVAQTNLGPWATANNGTYDEDKIAPYIDYVSEGTLSTEDSAGWVGFDDGEYDQPTVPNCEPVQNTSCDVADGGYFSVGSAPDYSDCECPACCLIDGEEYSYSLVKLYPSGTEIADGGIYGRFGSCTIYNNDEFDRDPVNFTCEIDGGTLEDPVPATDVDDEGLYDRVIFDCAECVDSGELILIPCPAEPLNVGVRHLFDEAVWEMKSTVRNSLIPLRTWKNRILDVTNNVPGDGLEYHNPLVADENRGAEPFDSYRHFVRLPLEYPRNGKQWNKAIAVCNNQSYFSAPPSLSETARKPDVARPVLYAVEYNNRDISGATTFYDEDYLVSTNTATFDEIQPGFEDVKISRDHSVDSPFAPSLISSYDPFETRIPNLDGSWKGGYYIYGLDRTLTGYRTTDLEAQHLIELPPSQYPVYDASSLNIPNTELPDDTDQASLKNYVVSYAYFVSDYSAADDPVFDPYTAHCWRTPKIDCLKRDTDENDEPICVEGNLDSRTAYLLHPTN